MARRLPYKSEQGLSVYQVEQVARSITEKWKNAPAIVVVPTIDSLPERIRSNPTRRSIHDGAPEGFYDAQDDSVYLVSANIQSRHRARMALFHEVKGHYGLRRFMGDDLDPFLDQVLQTHPDRCSAMAEKYEIDLSTTEGQRQAAEEVVANMAASGVKSTFMNRLFGAFRHCLRKIGLNIPVTDNDVRYIAARAGKVPQQGGAKDIPVTICYGKTEEPLAPAIESLYESLDAEPEDMEEDPLEQWTWDCQDIQEILPHIGIIDEFYHSKIKDWLPTVPEDCRDRVSYTSGDNPINSEESIVQSMEILAVDAHDVALLRGTCWNTYTDDEQIWHYSMPLSEALDMRVGYQARAEYQESCKESFGPR